MLKMGTEDDIISLKMSFDDDFFGLPLEPLHDFNVGLEASDLSSLLEEFEETEKLLNQHLCDLGNNTENLVGHQLSVKTSEKVTIRVGSSASMSSSKVDAGRKIAKKYSRVKRKKAGISLLAKPIKQSIKSMDRRPGSSNGSRFATYFIQDHDYCPATHP